MAIAVLKFYQQEDGDRSLMKENIEFFSVN
jgi:hypothetical protein